jgi:hypothetical protein
VKEFIAKYAASDEFADRLVVAYPNGRKPQLILMDDDENEQEALSITGWNTDAIRDYLNENIKKPEA